LAPLNSASANRQKQFTFSSMRGGLLWPVNGGGAPSLPL
jgi:hypothetical protein